ncbi:MAG: hypothetical protein ACE37F_31315 [Nannocystaceae bacterium]
MSLLGVRPIVISRLSNDVVVGGAPDFEIVMRSMRRGWMFARLAMDEKSKPGKNVGERGRRAGDDFTLVSSGSAVDARACP